MVEGYKRVQLGKKNVTLNEILKAVNIERNTESQESVQIEDNIAAGNTFAQQEIVTKSGHKISSFRETQVVSLFWLNILGSGQQ